MWHASHVELPIGSHWPGKQPGSVTPAFTFVAVGCLPRGVRLRLFWSSAHFRAVHDGMGSGDGLFHSLPLSLSGRHYFTFSCSFEFNLVTTHVSRPSSLSLYVRRGVLCLADGGSVLHEREQAKSLKAGVHGDQLLKSLKQAVCWSISFPLHGYRIHGPCVSSVSGTSRSARG